MGVRNVDVFGWCGVTYFYYRNYFVPIKIKVEDECLWGVTLCYFIEIEEFGVIYKFVLRNGSHFMSLRSSLTLGVIYKFVPRNGSHFMSLRSSLTLGVIYKFVPRNGSHFIRV
jgi:hypothetical protein